ncbi:methylated-DNA--[protein]-cysteine S-methyltransferase [Herbidospora sp. NEAU-GS84]|uniref:Methylated-DNA--[protein]-cysteine S-methyltransferase n=1 Tax=Herbidospora solisilvae TaxID=2696284 RepID=A0A7C9N0P5_9ACTN|nr:MULTISPECIES: methylated-DNA--[protein]-cysteine S-methyltransferase [Herbidospora]NAS23150.1 methylated-DNA--[protein]-cysteine S-methyltransferase [Herbidospora solisilvae]GLX92256.1 methylated-DNA--protein-cysteine methyltransferase [Herbidospora sp. NBRC 101105]
MGLQFVSVPTDVGLVVAAVTPVGVVATSFDDGPEFRDRVRERMSPFPDDPGEPETGEVGRQLTAYFAGELTRFTVPVDWRLMSTTQRRVLGLLFESVPYGRAVTYGDLARETGIPARAIGSIMGSNPIPIIVPCHRVVAGDGLGGFSGGAGVESKRRLLTMEGHLPPTLF